MRHNRSLRTLAPVLLCIAVAHAGMTNAFAHEPDAEEVALGSLVDAELAFARMGVERGVREAFLANFAEDGIAFEPMPVRLKQTWSARPAPADPLGLKLLWKPAQAGVARSFDMGYTTGPFTVSSTAQPALRHGVFFSVWQRGPDRPWKVLIDAGIATPGPVDFAALGAAPRPHFKGRANVAVERRRLLEAESSAFGNAASGITPNAFAQHVAADVRLHREGAAPIASRGTVAPAIARSMSRIVWMPIDARMSAAADMAFTYGSYRETDHDQRVNEGYYAHLWLRDKAGIWQLAYDIALPAKPR
jgi:hypothetical protein